MKSGRSSRPCKTGARISGVKNGSFAAVEEIRISISLQRIGHCSNAVAFPPTIAARASARTPERVRFLRLAQDFRLTDHHRIQARSDAKQMLDALFVLMPVKRGHVCFQ